MNARFIFLIVILCVSACVKAPVYKGDNYAFIKSSHAIVNANGKQVESVYTLDLEAGENTLVVLYRTYRHDYYCEFQWNSKPQTAYEITDQENKYPLTLYRWERDNDLWASRLDPVDPVKCTKKND
ncbi:hypothetical protein [Kaarinaea lacus]